MFRIPLERVFNSFVTVGRFSGMRIHYPSFPVTALEGWTFYLPSFPAPSLAGVVSMVLCYDTVQASWWYGLATSSVRVCYVCVWYLY